MSWFAVAAAVVSAVGAAVGTTVQVEQAKANQIAQEQALEYQRQVALQNAQLEETQAKDAQRRGEIEAGKYMQQVRAFKGSQQSIMAAHGLDLSSGTPLDIQTGTDIAGATDLQALMHNSALEAWGHRVQETNYNADAANLEWQKTATRTATKNLITGSLISGTFAGSASVGGALMNYNKGQQAYQPIGGSSNATLLTGTGPNSGFLQKSLYGKDWERYISSGGKYY